MAGHADHVPVCEALKAPISWFRCRDVDIRRGTLAAIRHAAPTRLKKTAAIC
jgi:hypothetical protein